jgi:hypothetical protein
MWQYIGMKTHRFKSFMHRFKSFMHRFKSFMRGVRMGMDPLVAFRAHTRPIRNLSALRRGSCAVVAREDQDVAEALARDWRAIGGDLFVAIQQHVHETGLEGPVPTSS